MMGESTYKTRDQLIAEKATGITPEVNAATQRLFDSGHRFEALARPLAEAIIEQELFPVTGSLEGTPLSASFDGLTLMGDVAFEHKRLNARLRAAFASIQSAVETGILVDDVHQTHCAAQLLPYEYQIQMEQQCLVSGCEKVLFMASDWTDDGVLIEEMHCWYTPNMQVRAVIVSGWAQFAADLACYEPPASKPAPAIGRAPDSLPALRIEISGAVTASNLAEFKATALAAIQGVNQALTTDADFADADASVKWCSDIESRVAAAKQHAMSQTADIDALFRTMDDISAEARRVRLVLEKSIKTEKERRRGEIVAGGVAALRAHIASLSQSMGREYMPAIAADFGGAVKGKRSLDSIQSAVNDELARAKIAANEVAMRIQTNLKTLHSTPGVVLTLFPDVATLVLKSCDDFALVVHSRQSQHEEKECQRLDAERERIRAEEQAKAQAEVQASARAAEAITRAAASTPAAPVVVPVAPVVVPAAPVVDDGDRINLSTINEQLYPIKLDAAGLAYLGFEPVATVKASKLYRASDLTAIRARLIERLTHPEKNFQLESA